MTRFLGITLCCVGVGCAIPVKIVQEAGPVSTDAVKRITENLNREAVVTVGDADFRGTLLSVDHEWLKVDDRREVREVSLNAVRTIRFRTASGSVARGSGAVIGGVTGAFAAEAGADRAGLERSGSKGTAVTVGVAVGGALLGYLAVRSLGDGDAIDVNPHLKTYTLDKAVGYSLTASEMQAYGIFTDLPLKAGEILLKAKVFLCEAGQYLVVYETHNGDVNGLSWECVDEEYVKQQKDKIRSLKQAKNIGMED